MDRTEPVRTPFDWLRDPEDRTGALKQIQFALARGWLNPATADVEPLRSALTDIAEDASATAVQRQRARTLLTTLADAEAPDAGRTTQLATATRKRPGES